MDKPYDPQEKQCLIVDEDDKGPFKVSIEDLNLLFETDNITSKKSNELLNVMGGLNYLLNALRTSDKDGIDTKNQELLYQRIQFYGDNKVKQPPLKNFFLFMYKQTEDFCIRILALASLMMFLLATVSADPFESIVQAVSILLAILAVVIIGAITDYKKERQFIQLYMEQEQEDKKYFTLIRDGVYIPLTPHSDLLVGDLIQVNPGDSLTFDGILIKGSNYLEVDESMISGLSESLKKRPIENTTDLERASQGSNKSNNQQSNDCFMRAGSNVFEGCGTMIICAVGDNTYSNRQKSSLEKDEEEDEHSSKSPLQMSTTQLAKYLVFIGCMCATFMFIILELYMVREMRQLQQQLFTKYTLSKILSDFIDAFLIIVLSIPEGLPLICTLSMAFSLNKLKQQGVIVRSLHVCQVLGGIDVMCFDKTGTLTKNNISVSNIYGDWIIHDVTATDQYEHGIDANWPLFRAVSEAIISNNTANSNHQKSQIRSNESKQSNIMIVDENIVPWTGNRIDCALMEFLDKKMDRDFVCEYMNSIKGQVVKYIGMNENKNNYTASVIKDKGDKHRIYIKGKPNDILNKCNEVVVKQSKDGIYQVATLFAPGGEFNPQKVLKEPMTIDSREQINNIIKSFGEQSLKTTAFAFYDISINNQSDQEWEKVIFDSHEYTFIAIVGLKDDIRPDSRETIQVLQEACIDVKMITGDTRITAVNVGKYLVMVSQEEADLEILRKSEILQQSRLLTQGQQQDEGQQKDESFLSDNNETQSADKIQVPAPTSTIIFNPLIRTQNQLISKSTPYIYFQDHKGDTNKDPFQKQLQQNIQTSTKKQPVVLNFQEYLIRVREILKGSEKFYQHTVITDKNCIQLINEIKLDKYALKKIIELNKDISIVADASQEQKQNFLRMLIGLNECTIGYVGDGNNDARSLRTSHVGFAPGHTATNVAKECSGVILMNDKLSGIGPCIKWGRNIFLNVKRFIYFQLSFYFTSIMIMLVATMTIEQQPFSVLQIIWLALVQDIFSAIAISTEMPQKTILAITRPFRQSESMIDPYLIKLIFCQFLYQGSVTIFMLFYTPTLFGVEPSQLHNINEIGSEYQPEFAVHFTIVFHLTALFQIVNLVNARRIGPYEYNTVQNIFSNRPFVYMILALIIVQQFIVYEGGKYFKTAPLTITQNSICCVLALGSLITFWISKKLFSSEYFSKPESSNINNNQH